MMRVIVTVSEEANLTVSENKTNTMLLPTLDQSKLAPPFLLETAGQRYKQMVQFVLSGGNIHEISDISLEIGGRICLMLARRCTIGRPPRYV